MRPGPTFDVMPTANSWFAIEWLPHGVLRIWEPHVSRLLRANMFLLRGRDRDMLVDAGMGVCSLRAFLAPYLDKPLVHVVTHTHVDHIGSTHEFGGAGFDGEIVMHPIEEPLLRAGIIDMKLSFDEYPQAKRDDLRKSGFDVSGALIAARPSPDFDPATWAIPGVAPDRLVEDGAVIELGDRRLEVLHTPGHSPGSISLWEDENRMLIGGDAIYDGLLIDTLPDSDPATYAETMKRLRQLNVSVVHGGHRESFGPEKYRNLIDQYLSK